MMGFIFTDFLEMLEREHGLRFTDDIISSAHLDNGGAFTAVGYYSKHDLEKLIDSLSQKIGKSKQQLYYEFGEHLAHCLVERHPLHYKDIDGLFSFLPKVNDWLGYEIGKLYPQKERPLFRTKKLDDQRMEFYYQSRNLMSDMAEGCLAAHARLFGEKVIISRNTLDETGENVLFLIEKK